MTKVVGSFALGSTGNGISITGLGINPNKLRLIAGPKNGDSSTDDLSIGSVDASGNQFVVLRHDDHAGHYAFSAAPSSTLTTPYCIWVRDYTNTWVNVLRAKFNSFITDGFKLDVDYADSSYPIYLEAED